MSIAGRAVSTMITASGWNDLLRIYFVTQQDGIDYNLAYIGSDFSLSEAGEFDKKYMNALFDYGYQQARHGYPWRKVPPFSPARKNDHGSVRSCLLFFVFEMALPVSAFSEDEAGEPRCGRRAEEPEPRGRQPDVRRAGSGGRSDGRRPAPRPPRGRPLR